MPRKDRTGLPAGEWTVYGETRPCGREGCAGVIRNPQVKQLYCCMGCAEAVKREKAAANWRKRRGKTDG